MPPIYASPNGNTATMRDGMIGRVSVRPNALNHALAFRSEYVSVPAGWRNNAITRPLKDGGIACYIQGVSETTASAAGSYAVGSVTIAGTSTAEANGFLTAERTVTIAGVGSVTVSAAGSYANGSVTIRVNELSQDDVTGAVLEGKVEGETSVKEALRVILAYVAGKTTIDDATGTVAFRDQADTKDRILAILDGNVRSSVTIDGTD